MDINDKERELKIRSILDQELADGAALVDMARARAARVLIREKGYRADEVRNDVVFEVALENERASSSVDYLVTLDGKKAMIVKCASGSLDSRQRQALAAARVISSPPVPVAVVTDPATAIVLTSAKGDVLGEGFEAIPSREALLGLLSAQPSAPLAPQRLEKEKRILLAFDALKCCVPQGADGGVRIGDDPDAPDCERNA